MDKKPSIIKALMSDLGLKTLQLPSKDGSLNSGRHSESGACSLISVSTDISKSNSTPPIANTTSADDSSMTMDVPESAFIETESESEGEDGYPPGDDEIEIEKGHGNWKMEINFLLNEKDVEPERDSGIGGGGTMRHPARDNGAVPIWKEGDAWAKKRRRGNSIGGCWNNSGSES